MRYYKVIAEGYILMIGTGIGGTEITKQEYDTIMSIIKNKPNDPDGMVYMLRTDLTWELLPAQEPGPEDANEHDYQDALEQMGVSFDADQ